MSLFSRFLLASCLSYSSFSYAQGLTLSSPDIRANSTLTETQVFNSFGCTGKNISPALAWKNAPKNTKSFAVTVYDPDAPTGSGWWHWLVYNISSQSTGLDAGVGTEASTLLPAGAIQGRTDFGSHSFGGACPPKGDKPHRYIFTIHALNTEKIELPADASAAMIGYMLHSHLIAKASFTAKYGR
jgi:hypothetical protein